MEWAGRVAAAVPTVVAALLIARVARRAVSAALQARADDRRAATLAPAVQSLVRALVLGTGVVTALHQLELNVTTVLAGAGVLGLAIGFGAQTLVRDIISGFFLIVDGIVEAGDHITFNDVSGTVEEVVKVKALEHWAVERELTKEIKEALDALGAELPLPRQVVYHRGEPPKAQPNPR